MFTCATNFKEELFFSLECWVVYEVSYYDVLSVTKVLIEVKSHLLADNERRTVALRVVLSAGESRKFLAMAADSSFGSDHHCRCTHTVSLKYKKV